MPAHKTSGSEPPQQQSANAGQRCHSRLYYDKDVTDIIADSAPLDCRHFRIVPQVGPKMMSAPKRRRMGTPKTISSASFCADVLNTCSILRPVLNIDKSSTPEGEMHHRVAASKNGEESEAFCWQAPPLCTTSSLRLPTRQQIAA